MPLTNTKAIAYPANTVEKKAVGFGDSLWSGERPPCFSEAAFFMSARVSYGRAGWDSREAMPVLHRFANPFGSALPFGDGERFVSRTGAHILSQSQTRRNASKPRIDLTKRRFGRLTVVEFHSIERHMTMWRCVCDCGTEINVHRGSLTNGATQSCGCLHRERTSSANGKHGACETLTYARWKSMIGRCTRKNSADWPNYGGRGITVCDGWLHSFENFLADMGECPSKKYTLERNDSNGNYEPSNCRWATKLEQARNTSRNRTLTFQGKTLCISEWAEITGLPYTTIIARLNRGKTDAEALAGGASICLHGISSAAPCAQCEQEIGATTC
jgi:hypothetical protein